MARTNVQVAITPYIVEVSTPYFRQISCRTFQLDPEQRSARLEKNDHPRRFDLLASPRTRKRGSAQVRAESPESPR